MSQLEKATARGQRRSLRTTRVTGTNFGFRDAAQAAAIRMDDVIGQLLDMLPAGTVAVVLPFRISIRRERDPFAIG